MKENVGISASELSNWVWCPRSYWYRYIQNLPPLPTQDTIKGLLLHRLYKEFFINLKKGLNESNVKNFLEKRVPEIVDSSKKAIEVLELNKETLLEEMRESAKTLIFRVCYGFSKIPLYIERTFKIDGLTARIDTLFKEEETFKPGDLKLDVNNSLSTKLQITLGAIILEHVFKTKITKGTIISCKDWNEYDFEITDDLRQLVYELKEIITNFKLHPYLPRIEYNPYKCNNCSFRHLCKLDDGDKK